MLRVTTTVVLVFVTAIPALAASKLKGTTTLKDFQPSGSVDKEHKHQAYDLFFEAQNMQYTCRTNPKKSVNATDFVVGSSVNYEIDGQNGKIRTTQGKQVECKIVRVEAAPSK
jgi:uncharacterized protein YcfJ